MFGIFLFVVSVVFCCGGFGFGFVVVLGGFLFVLLLLFVCGIFWCLFFICFLITKRMVEVSVQVFIEVLPVFFSLCGVCVYELETSQLKILSWPGHKSKLFNSWHSFGPGQAVLSCRKIRYS